MVICVCVERQKGEIEGGGKIRERGSSENEIGTEAGVAQYYSCHGAMTFITVI